MVNLLLFSLSTFFDGIQFSSMPSFLSLKNQSRMKPLANMAEILSMGAYRYVFWSFVLGLSVLADNV